MSPVTPPRLVSPAGRLDTAAGQVHDVPADPAGPGRPGRLQPPAQRPGLADVRHPADAGPPGPVPWPDLCLQPGAGRALPRAAAFGVVADHRPAAVLPVLAHPFVPMDPWRRRGPGLRAGLRLQICAGLARPAHLQPGRGRRIRDRADRAEHRHLVGGDPCDAVAAGSRRPAGAVPHPEVPDGRRLPRGGHVHCDRGTAAGGGDLRAGPSGRPWRSARCSSSSALCSPSR